MNPLRICFVLESAHLAFGSEERRMGGMEVQFRIVPLTLASMGHEVFVLSLRPIQCDGISWQRCDRMLRRIRDIRPALVVTTIATKTALRTAVACRILRIPFIYWLPHDFESELKIGRTSHGSPIGRLLFVFMLRHLTTKIIVQNAVQLANLQRRWFSRLIQFRNAFPYAKLGPKKKHIVLWVARFLEWKRPELFADMARRLSHREFVMIAPGVTPAFRKSCTDIPNLCILDYVPYGDIGSYYAEARVFVNTSTYEGFPNSYGDAVVHGTPIVSMNVDPDGLFARYGHGFLVPDLEGMCSKVEELFTAPTFRKAVKGTRRYLSEIHRAERTVPVLLQELLSP